MRSAQIGTIALVALVLSPSAGAQTSGSFDQARTRSFLDPEQLNASACEEDDGEATLTLRGQSFTGARFVGYVFEGVSGTQERPQCFSYTIAGDEGRLAFNEPLDVTPNNFVQELAVPLDVLMGDACTVEGGRRLGDRALCVYMVDSRNVSQASIGFFLAVDTAVPAQPEITSLRPGNGRALFSIGNVDERSADVYEFLVQHRRCGGEPEGDAGEAPESPAADAGPGGDEPAVDASADSICDAPGDFEQTVLRTKDVSLTGLQNGVRYELRVAVRDDFGNRSPFSDVALIRPAAGSGPLDRYDGAGSPWSTVPPSCASTEGALSLFGLVGLLGFFALPRRRRPVRTPRGWLSLALVPALFAALPSQAQDFAPASATMEARDGEVTLSLFAGPYRPAIDSENGGAIFPIYDCFFDNELLAEFGGSLDYHLLDVFGSLQLGFGINVTQAKGFTLTPGDDGAASCDAKTNDSVELTVVKLKPQLVYRLDPLLDWFGFPLVPYGRLGLVGAIYAFTENGVFPEPATDAQNPLGLVLGWEAAGGLMLALDFWDFLDPFSKWGTMRGRAHGVFNHAYLYGEALWQPIDNFGRPSLRLSPTDPFTGSGAPWTMHFGVAVELL